MTHALMLAWRPFLDPLNMHSQQAALWMMVPLIVGICVFYKAMKVPHVRELPIEAARLTGLVLVSMVLAGGALWLVVRYLLG